ncbi:hypothetical protein AOLI_G00060900 [Acnodon oligacanthus]
MAWVSMPEQLHARIISLSTTPSEWSGVKYASIGIWSDGILCSDERHFSIWQSNGRVWV